MHMKDHLLGSVRMTIVMTALLGFLYPAVVWGVGRLAFREEAAGSFLRRDDGAAPAVGVGSAIPASGAPILGSALIGQLFHSRNLFHGRPSAAGAAGYDAIASGGTNLGPTSKKLADSIGAAVAAARLENPAAAGSPVPADAVTSSASGLDPHISPAFALWQVPRVARGTGIEAAELARMIAARTEGRTLGVWGEPRVNVLRLNLDLLARGVAP
ncbi:MAG: K(+)-transporting ATPase subunit C [Thermoanaerobaculia bacterium]|jgi:K+-transporting ATPase ATPase C chain